MWFGHLGHQVVRSYVADFCLEFSACVLNRYGSLKARSCLCLSCVMDTLMSEVK